MKKATWITVLVLFCCTLPFTAACNTKEKQMKEAAGRYNLISIGEEDDFRTYISYLDLREDGNFTFAGSYTQAGLSIAEGKWSIENETLTFTDNEGDKLTIAETGTLVEGKLTVEATLEVSNDEMGGSCVFGLDYIPPSHFEAIKTAYRDAGHVIDPDGTSQYTAALSAFSSLGYTSCLIGKYYEDEPGVLQTLYILYSASTLKEARELQDGLGEFPNAVYLRGRDILMPLLAVNVNSDLFYDAA